jgi:hypothetical protein
MLSSLTSIIKPVLYQILDIAFFCAVVGSVLWVFYKRTSVNRSRKSRTP